MASRTVGFRGLQQIADKGAIFEEEIMEASASFVRKLIALQSTQNAPKRSAPKSSGKGPPRSLQSQTKIFRGCRAFADPASKRGAEFFGASPSTRRTISMTRREARSA